MFNLFFKKYFIMSIRNKVSLIGKAGRDVEVSTFEKGMRASVSLATNDYYTNSAGEKVEETQWHNIVAFGKLAEIMQKFVQKGKEIAVQGKLMYRTYESEGKKMYITEISAEEILLLGSR